MAMNFVGKFMFDKRASPMLSRNEITKYGKPKPGGGVKGFRRSGGGYASADGLKLVNKPAESVDVGLPASMPVP